MANASYVELIRVLVGPEQREFVVHRKLLCASSTFFRDSIEAVPAGLAASSPLSSSPPPAPAQTRRSPAVIWLASESAGMFELFVLWLYRREAFRTVIEEALMMLAAEGEDEDEDEADEELWLRPGPPPPSPSMASSSSSSCASSPSPSASPTRLLSQSAAAAQCCSDLHWNLVQLHLFAALIDLPVLQDVVMDALQDLYLRFDWEATPELVRFLYVDSDPFAAFRLRKWAVALLAWTLSNQEDEHLDSNNNPLRCLLAQSPALGADYHAHVAKMLVSQADVRIKNPQLRIPSNHLRREDRLFGFRQCSFHSHRRAVGEGRCPHRSSHSRHSKSANAAAAAAAASASALTAADAKMLELQHRRPLSTALSRSSTTSEPRQEDLPAWSPLSVSTSNLTTLGISTTF